MFSLIKKASILIAVVVVGCSQQRQPVAKAFYDIDSLVSAQQKFLQTSGHKLVKSVRIDHKTDETSFVPDSLQWTYELDIFRSLDQINKAAFSDAYTVTDSRDANSNLTVREYKANRPAPVSIVRLYFLKTPKDLRKIEGTLTEENTLYINDRRMIMELDHLHLISNYRIEGSQKMVMSDSVQFVITGDVGIK
ncbi:MAG TPA: hypothetical protein VF473_04475 [Cyclobacteriaceae bacterium]